MLQVSDIQSLHAWKYVPPPVTYIFHFDSKQQSVIQQLHARKGRLIVMCSKEDAASMNVGKYVRVIKVPHVEDCLQPVINIVPLQVG